MKSKEDVVIAFKQGDTDDRILKSMAEDTEHEYDSEELSKALDKAKLVQKEIQVRGKNGQMHTRKQWVKAGEDQPSTNQPKAQEEQKNEFRVGQKVKSDQLRGTWEITSDKPDMPNKIVVKNSRGSLKEVPKTSLTIIESQHTPAAGGSGGDDGGNKVTGKGKTINQNHWTKVGTSQEAKAQIAQMLASGKSREDCMSDFKAQGVTWKEHENPAINWMRAAMAMNKHLTAGAVNAQTDTAGAENSGKKEQKFSVGQKVKSDQLKGTWEITDEKPDMPNKIVVKNSRGSLKEVPKDSLTIIESSTEETKANNSVIGTDYTQLTTEKESGTIEGEAHNMMVGWLKSENGGNKKPTESQIKQAANSLKDAAIKRVISSYNQDELVHQLAMAKHFTKLAGGNMDHMTLERTYQDVVSGSSYTQEQKCNALAKLCGKDYDSTGDYVRKYASNSMANASIVPMSKGYFEVTFSYDDGVSRKERFDSVKSAKEAADKFIEKEEKYAAEKKSK